MSENSGASNISNSPLLKDAPQRARDGSISLGELANWLGAELHGDASSQVQGMATLANASANQISFLANTNYQHQLKSTQAGAALIKAESLSECPCNALVLADPYIAFAKCSHLFDPAPKPTGAIHASAVVADSAVVEVGVSINANAVIGEGVVVGAGSVIGANAVVEDFAQLGKGCVIHSNVTLYHHVHLGDRVTVHSGTVIGADGFGFAQHQGRWNKIAQVGSVRIGNDVDIGACSSIDRGALDDTVIEEGVIIDNQVQIAHNCVVGAHTAIAGCVGIAGSTQIGRYCTFAGQAGVAGHITICDKVHVNMQAQVTSSITEPGTYSSGTGLHETARWRRLLVRFKQLDRLFKKS